jgi:subtilisin family serine protease
MENRQDVFDAVRAATLKGIHVIAAGGNGSSNLDSSVYKGIFDRSKRDSGSVIVGATDGATLKRASFSNYGKIVDANGWGRNVYTTGYGDLFYPINDSRQKYTKVFSGTSSATPIVTSAAGAILSAAKQQLGRVLKPKELRDLLRKYGTAVPSGLIGPRPDLKKLMAAIGLPRGLSLTAPAKFGSNAALALSGKPADQYALVISDAPAVAVLPFGRLLVESSTMILLQMGTFDSKGEASFSAKIPVIMGLLHKEFHWQALRVGVAMDLTSSVVTFIHL